MKQTSQKFILCCCIAGVLGFAGCAKENQAIQPKNSASQSTNSNEQPAMAEANVFAMDTFMKIVAYGEQAEQAVQVAQQEIQRLDALLSTGKIESEIGQINQNAGGHCSQDTAYLLQRSLQLYQDTQGAFNIMLYPLMEAWGFVNGEYNVPSQETLDQLLPLTEIAQLQYDAENNQLQFMKQGMKIDFGGIAKGYTSARIMEIFENFDVASGVVNLGGNVQVKGKKPDGTDWKIGIQNPQKPEEYLGVLEISDQAVITSGGYERFFEQDGQQYHHILNPATGKTARSGLSSVTIVSPDGTLADGLSTSLFVMGKEAAEQYWRNHSQEFQAILVTDDGAIYVTEGIENCFEPEQKEIHIIKQ